MEKSEFKHSAKRKREITIFDKNFEKLWKHIKFGRLSYFELKPLDSQQTIPAELSQPKTSSYISREAFRGKNHAKYEYMKLDVNLNFQQLFWQVSQNCIPHSPSWVRFESSFCTIRSRSRWRLRITMKKVQKLWKKNFPSRNFTIGKNTSKHSLFIEMTCAKSAKKIKFTFWVFLGILVETKIRKPEIFVCWNC